LAKYEVFIMNVNYSEYHQKSVNI